MSGASSSSTAPPRKSKDAILKLRQEAGNELALLPEEQSQLALQNSSKKKDIVVVPNPFPDNRIPPKVLAEDDYTDAVSHIIERDFFPDLAHLRVAHQLMEARKSGDEALAEELRWKLINLSRPTPLSSMAATPGRLTPGATPLREADLLGAATPAGATPRMSAWERDDDDVESTVAMSTDTPSNACLQLANGKQAIVDLQKVRLDDFHSVFTSEDNAAFEDIIRSDNAKKAARQWWIEAAELKHNTKHKEYKDAIMDGSKVESDTALVGNQFTGRNTMSFKPPTLAIPDVEKPKVDFKNTRFTTAQQAELDSMLDVAVASRQAQMNGEREIDVGARMAHSGSFGLAAFQGQAAMRSIGGRISTPLLPNPEVRGYPMVQTPTFLPGVGGLSPLMTYGKLGSTPRCLDDDGPSFKMIEKSDREQAAEKLQRGATQKLREAKQHTKMERLRALGLTPPGSVTPGRTGRATPGGATGTTARRTPGSTVSKIAPLSPIGALIQRAKKMAQQGGRFGIGASPATPALTPVDEGSSRKKQRKNTGASGSAKSADSGNLHASSITDGLLLE